MDLKTFLPDFSFVNTLPPKSQHDVLDLSVLRVLSIFHLYLLFKSASTLYMQLPNMSKNSAAHQKKVEHAARKLLNRWTGGVCVTRGDATTSRMRDDD